MGFKWWTKNKGLQLARSHWQWKPKIILFDETTSALDPETIEMRRYEKDLAHENFTIVLVTHEMGFAKEVGDRIVFMDHGVIIEQNSPKSF